MPCPPRWLYIHLYAQIFAQATAPFLRICQLVRCVCLVWDILRHHGPRDNGYTMITHGMASSLLLQEADSMLQSVRLLGTKAVKVWFQRVPRCSQAKMSLKSCTRLASWDSESSAVRLATMASCSALKSVCSIKSPRCALSVSRCTSPTSSGNQDLGMTFSDLLQQLCLEFKALSVML